MNNRVISTAAVIHGRRCQPEGYLDLVIGESHIASCAAPGQFVMVGLGTVDPILPRPFDIVESYPEKGAFRLIIKIVGKATAILNTLKEGDSVRITGPLGAPITDFNFSSMALLARGCGAAAVHYFLQKAKKRKITVHTVLSASTEKKLVCRKEITALSDTIHFATDDGSAGEKLLGTLLLQKVLTEKQVERVYACGGGPFYLPHLVELERQNKNRVYLFLESYMACGFGHCHGCAVQKKGGGYALVCQDGPLFKLGEVENPCLIYQ